MSITTNRMSACGARVVSVENWMRCGLFGRRSQHQRTLASLAEVRESQATQWTQSPLSSGQRKLLTALESGESVYFTGKAGSGKSEVLFRFIASCRMNPSKKLTTEITAPTGIAASHINGGTLYSRFGLKPTIDPVTNSPSEISKRALANPNLLARYVLTTTIIIDEISMVHKRDFEAISKTMAQLKSDKTVCMRVWRFIHDKLVRKGMSHQEIAVALGGIESEAQLLQRGREKKHLPFGGAQVVLSGDFYQLPPIERETNALDIYRKEVSDLYGPDKADAIEFHLSPYVFTSNEWLRLKREAGMKTFVLGQSFRQSDPQFVEFLDRLRVGEWDDSMKKYLGNRINCYDKRVDVKPIKLCTFRRSANEYNAGKLARIESNEYQYPSHDSVIDEDTQLSLVLSPNNNGSDSSRIPNMNDATDVVIDPENLAFDPTAVRHVPEPKELQRHLCEQYSSEFESMPVPSLLSLRKGAQVILARNVNLHAGLVNGTRGRVVGFEASLDNLTGASVMLPVVEFALSNGRKGGGAGGVGVWVVPYDRFESQVAVGRSIERRQIPLRLGWGLTIHRAQGMTLDSVIVDMPKAFASGQAYVALSRVKNLEGLSVTKNLHKESVIVSSLVKEFMREIDLENRL